MCHVLQKMKNDQFNMYLLMLLQTAMTDQARKDRVARHHSLRLNYGSKYFSWVISGTSVTVEWGQRFLHGFVIFEGSLKN